MTRDERAAIDHEVLMALWGRHLTESQIANVVIKIGIVDAHASVICGAVRGSLNRLKRKKFAKYDRAADLWSGVAS